MKTSTLIISAILLAATFIPLLYLISQTSRKERKVKKAIQKLCDLNTVRLSNLEIHGDLILGIDTNQKILICSNRKDISKSFEIIDLNQQSECKIKTLKSHRKQIDWVSLEFLNNTTKKDIVFYKEDEDDDAVITDPHKCLNDAEKWQTLIKPLLKAS